MGIQLDKFLNGIVPIPRTRFLRSFEGNHVVPGLPPDHYEIQNLICGMIQWEEWAKWKELKNKPKPTRFVAECFAKYIKDGSMYDGKGQRRFNEERLTLLGSFLKDQTCTLSCNYQGMYRAVKSAHFSSCMSNCYRHMHQSYFTDNRIGVVFISGSKCSMVARSWVTQIENKGLLLFGFQGQQREKGIAQALLTQAMRAACERKGLTLFVRRGVSYDGDGYLPFKDQEINHPDGSLEKWTSVTPIQ